MGSRSGYGSITTMSAPDVRYPSSRSRPPRPHDPHRNRQLIWNVANLIRDSFKRGKYQHVILPLTVLRRLDCVVAPTKENVLPRNAELQELGQHRGRRSSDRGCRRWLGGVDRTGLAGQRRQVRASSRPDRANALGDRAGVCVDPKTQELEGGDGVRGELPEKSGAGVPALEGMGQRHTSIRNVGSQQDNDPSEPAFSRVFGKGTEK